MAAVLPTRAAGRVYEHLFTAYRHTWRGSLVVGFLWPLLYLGALGGGVGHLVDSRQHATSTLGGLPYATFLAPGLLAATVTQTAVGESTWPVAAKMLWQRQYHAMVSSPLSIGDIVFGHASWIATRLASVAAVFLLVASLFGLVVSPWALLAAPAGVLAGMAFCTPVMAFAAGQDDDGGFALLNRLVLVPLTLFSGTFFPVSQLPAWCRPVAWFTPLWHGSQLLRQLTTGAVHASALLHLTVLAGFAVAGYAVALRTYARRLLA